MGNTELTPDERAQAAAEDRQDWDDDVALDDEPADAIFSEMSGTDVLPDRTYGWGDSGTRDDEQCGCCGRTGEVDNYSGFCGRCHDLALKRGLIGAAS